MMDTIETLHTIRARTANLDERAALADAINVLAGAQPSDDVIRLLAAQQLRHDTPLAIAAICGGRAEVCAGGAGTEEGGMTLWNLGRANRLFLSPIVSNDDFDQQVAWWLNGRVCGRYVSVRIPWRQRLDGKAA
jgi:hypothetical protein